jgi:hypothetical protein
MGPLQRVHRTRGKEIFPPLSSFPARVPEDKFNSEPATAPRARAAAKMQTGSPRLAPLSARAGGSFSSRREGRAQPPGLAPGWPWAVASRNFGAATRLRSTCQPASRLPPGLLPPHRPRVTAPARLAWKTLLEPLTESNRRNRVRPPRSRL